MLIIGFGVTEVLLSTLVFTCDLRQPRRPSADQAEPQVLTFLHSTVLSRYEIPRQLYRLWADHRGQQATSRGSGPAGRPGPAVIQPRFTSAQGRLAKGPPRAPKSNSR